MPESIQPPNNAERAQSTPNLKYPTEQELQEFEVVRNFPPFIGDTIESFAKDPEHPTEEEIAAMHEGNARLRPSPMTFEEWFGYPDPREHGQNNDQGSLAQSDDHAR